MRNEIVEALRRRILVLEDEKAMLEKRLRFKELSGEMRASLQMTDKEAFDLKQKNLDLKRDNHRLKQIVNKNDSRVNNLAFEEDLKTIKKQLKNQRKMHTADLEILSTLQLVKIIRILQK